MGETHKHVANCAGRGLPVRVRDELRRALVGDKAVPRNSHGGRVLHRIRYERAQPVELTETALCTRIDSGESMQSVLAYPHMLVSAVTAYGAERYPLDLVCQRELSLAEQRAALCVDEIQMDLQRPSVPICTELLRRAAQYRGHLTALEIWAHAYIESQAVRS